MATTQYQVLYRYINEATNTPITNDMNNQYEEVCEFYTDPNHKIFSTNQQDQLDAIDEQQQMISFGNSSDNPKTDMLFAYNGTKKIKHKKWIEDAVGYVVRDWAKIRDKIGNKGDFTKEFTTLYSNTPEDGGVVVCTEAVMKKYFPNATIVIAADNKLADEGTSLNPFYSINKINSMIVESTIFKLNTTEDYTSHGEPSKYTYLRNGYAQNTGSAIYYGPVAIGINNMMSYSNRYSSAYGSYSDIGLYSRITVTQQQIQTDIIPGHYEEVADAPYLIKDTYKRIQLSPWFVNATYGSLTAALERAKKLVDMIGIDNVKVTKIVPFDQSIKIK